MGKTQCQTGEEEHAVGERREALQREDRLTLVCIGIVLLLCCTAVLLAVLSTSSFVHPDLNGAHPDVKHPQPDLDNTRSKLKGVRPYVNGAHPDLFSTHNSPGSAKGRVQSNLAAGVMGATPSQKGQQGSELLHLLKHLRPYGEHGREHQRVSSPYIVIDLDDKGSNKTGAKAGPETVETRPEKVIPQLNQEGLEDSHRVSPTSRRPTEKIDPTIFDYIPEGKAPTHFRLNRVTTGFPPRSDNDNVIEDDVTAAEIPSVTSAEMTSSFKGIPQHARLTSQVPIRSVPTLTDLTLRETTEDNGFDAGQQSGSSSNLFTQRLTQNSAASKARTGAESNTGEARSGATGGGLEERELARRPKRSLDSTRSRRSEALRRPPLPSDQESSFLSMGRDSLTARLEAKARANLSRFVGILMKIRKLISREAENRRDDSSVETSRETGNFNEIGGREDPEEEAAAHLTTEERGSGSGDRRQKDLKGVGRFIRQVTARDLLAAKLLSRYVAAVEFHPNEDIIRKLSFGLYENENDHYSKKNIGRKYGDVTIRRRFARKDFSPEILDQEYLLNSGSDDDLKDNAADEKVAVGRTQGGIRTRSNLADLRLTGEDPTSDFSKTYGSPHLPRIGAGPLYSKVQTGVFFPSALNTLQGPPILSPPAFQSFGQGSRLAAWTEQEGPAASWDLQLASHDNGEGQGGVPRGRRGPALGGSSSRSGGFRRVGRDGEDVGVSGGTGRQEGENSFIEPRGRRNEFLLSALSGEMRTAGHSLHNLGQPVFLPHALSGELTTIHQHQSPNFLKQLMASGQRSREAIPWEPELEDLDAYGVKGQLSKAWGDPWETELLLAGKPSQEKGFQWRGEDYGDEKDNDREKPEGENFGSERGQFGRDGDEEKQEKEAEEELSSEQRRWRNMQLATMKSSLQKANGRRPWLGHHGQPHARSSRFSLESRMWRPSQDEDTASDADDGHYTSSPHKDVPQSPSPEEGGMIQLDDISDESSQRYQQEQEPLLQQDFAPTPNAVTSPESAWMSRFQRQRHDPPFAAPLPWGPARPQWQAPSPLALHPSPAYPRGETLRHPDRRHAITPFYAAAKRGQGTLTSAEDDGESFSNQDIILSGGGPQMLSSRDRNAAPPKRSRLGPSWSAWGDEHLRKAAGDLHAEADVDDDGSDTGETFLEGDLMPDEEDGGIFVPAVAFLGPTSDPSDESEHESPGFKSRDPDDVDRHTMNGANGGKDVRMRSDVNDGTLPAWVAVAKAGRTYSLPVHSNLEASHPLRSAASYRGISLENIQVIHPAGVREAAGVLSRLRSFQMNGHFGSVADSSLSERSNRLRRSVPEEGITNTRNGRSSCTSPNDCGRLRKDKSMSGHDLTETAHKVLGRLAETRNLQTKVKTTCRKNKLCRSRQANHPSLPNSLRSSFLSKMKSFCGNRRKCLQFLSRSSASAFHHPPPSPPPLLPNPRNPRPSLMALLLSGETTLDFRRRFSSQLSSPDQQEWPQGDVLSARGTVETNETPTVMRDATADAKDSGKEEPHPLTSPRGQQGRQS